MTSKDLNASVSPMMSSLTGGGAWLAVIALGATAFFWPGILSLVSGWGTPEYSYGPLVPVLSAYMFLRQMRDEPPTLSPTVNYIPGVVVLALAVVLGALGRLVQIEDLVSYALILWVGGTVLVSLGWRTGARFWPAVLHLIFMLPLPGVLYYGLSTYLQGVSSQLGVFFLQLLQVPVFLDGNIIDLGVYKLQVAEACSGLRYLFPILSFSYFFSTLYRGPVWHKLVLLAAAGPITVVMNSVRIAIAGVVVNQYGTAFVEGLSHFLEGWVIFIVCILLLFALTWVLLSMRRPRVGLVQALDLDMTGVWQQAAKIRGFEASRVLKVAAAFVVVASALWYVIPARPAVAIDRQPFVLFPTQVGEWLVGPPQRLDEETARVLKADDYLASRLESGAQPAPVDLFMAWYKDQLDGGTHSPTDCLPAAGWEIGSLSEIQIASDQSYPSFRLNRAVIRKGLQQMLVYFWYEQQGERTSSSYYSRLLLTWSKFTSGRSDGALVRLITPINESESLEAAEGRLHVALKAVVPVLSQFVPAAS